MSTREMLIAKIRLIDDESILADLIRMIDLELQLAGSVVKLSDEQRDFIDKGLLEKNEGKTMTHEEAKRKTQEWLRKR
jgi:predicted transcriptional regulator